MDNRMGRILLVCSACFVLVMLGTRLATLHFGQIFANPPASPVPVVTVPAPVSTTPASAVPPPVPVSADPPPAAPDTTVDRKIIADLTAQVATLQADVARLNDEIEKEKARPATVVYVRTPTRRARAQEAAPSVETAAPQDADGTVVHRGDDAAKVRRVFGKPSSVQPWPTGGERWYYNGYSNFVLLVDAKVSSWDNM